MGAGGAKLASYSSLQLANYVSLLGREYELYGTRIIRNGITGADLDNIIQVHRALGRIRGNDNSQSSEQLLRHLMYIWYETTNHEEDFFWMYDDYPKTIYRFLIEEWIKKPHED
jgi:hypothetical protein